MRADRARADMERAVGPGHPWALGCVLNNLAATLGADHPRTRAARHRERPYWDFEPLTT